MNPRNNLSGAVVPPIREYAIAPETDIVYGQVVKLTGGMVAAAAAAETGEILGVAAENHTGAADALNVRNDGKVIRVYDAPDQVFACPAPVITCASGSATSIVAGSDLATFADDDFNGGLLMLVEKAEGSTNTDAIGTVRSISDFTATSKTFTVSSGGTPTAGDKYAVFPPVGFAKGNLSADGTKLVLTATANLPIKVAGCELQGRNVLLVPAVHAQGNDEA